MDFGHLNMELYSSYILACKFIIVIWHHRQCLDFKLSLLLLAKIARCSFIKYIPRDLKFLMVPSSSYSLGPSLDLYAFNLAEDNSTFLG